MSETTVEKKTVAEEINTRNIVAGKKLVKKFVITSAITMTITGAAIYLAGKLQPNSTED